MNLSNKDIENINKFSNKLAIYSCEIISKAKTSHIGSVLSIRDILSLIFYKYLKFDKKKLTFNNSLILSKGHAGAGFVFFFKRNNWRKRTFTYCKNGSKLLAISQRILIME